MYTGNSDSVFLFGQTATVYPCVYRELNFHITDIWEDIGFIPVYTGNSDRLNASQTTYAVYPCVYRELAAFYFQPDRNLGLSLCIQGTL